VEGIVLIVGAHRAAPLLTKIQFPGERETLLRVLGFGDNVVDKYEHQRLMYPGGNSLNFAVFAKQLGADSAYMGIFGDDPEGEHVIATLQALGLETFKCRQHPGENGCARVTLVDGERVFLGSNAGGIRKDTPYVLDRFDLDYMRTFDLVHSSCYSYTESELPRIKAAGVLVSFDFSDDSAPDYIASVAPHVDTAFISLGDMGKEQVLETLQRLTGFGPRLVVASRGAHGLAAFNGDQFYVQPAIPVEPLDTMGAGDSAIAAFMLGYIEGVKSGAGGDAALIPQCLDAAARFAAQTCMTAGSFGFGKSYLSRSSP
jgi:fructoselysine 6-kinase